MCCLGDDDICLTGVLLPLLFAHMKVRAMTDEYTEDTYERNNVRQRPRNLLARGSKPILIEEFNPDTGEWRRRIKMSRKLLDDAGKARFLTEYRKWGRMGDAAAAVPCSTQVVRKEIANDEDFAEAVLMAEEDYRDKLIGHHQDLIFNGTIKKSYDRNGNLVSEETIYPIRLIELELKKHDSGYREKQEVAVNHSGGVLVAPAEMGSIDDWEKKFSNMKDITPLSPRVEDEDGDNED